MSYHYKNLEIEKLSVVGAGQIGPDICLHFSKVFAKSNVQLVLVDIAESALETARAKIEKKIDKGIKTGAFKPAMAEAMNNSILYTTDYQKTAGSNIVLEAATEDEKIKGLIFSQLEKICDDNCLFLSNSSHMQPEVIFNSLKEQSRALVVHYFFPAERNPIVEIVPSQKTDPATTELLMGFYEAIGKVPIQVKSSYGYAVDPIFEGLCQTAILCLEKEYGTVAEIDEVACKTLGLGIGPFTALTLTGGNPITNHGLEEMHRLLIPWFRSPKALQEVVKNNAIWKIAKRGDKIEVKPEKETILKKEFLGAYFALSSYILDLGICDINDLNMACEIALVVKAPFTLMNKMGIDKAHMLTKDFCDTHLGFPFPKSLHGALHEGGWKLSNVTKKIHGNVAVLTIRRPKVLNALNSYLVRDIQNHFEKIENDSSLTGSVLTGFGAKAFVSGADINELAACHTPEEGYLNSKTFQEVTNYIENLKKPVVCALNGFAFGGGNELALACTARICKKNMPVVVCQPEVNLGFIPGAGATQRLPRLIGFEKASEILRTGRPVSSREAVEIGLAYKEVEGDLVEAGISLVRQIANGEISPKPIPKEPIINTGAIPKVDLKHLSKKIDSILTSAIFDGAKMPLKEGLDFEARLFGECIDTEDMKIGLANFKNNGPKTKAKFVHR